MENLFDLSGKVAVVTGASRGLGQYFGRALARAGADLVITSRDTSRLSDFQAEIEGLGRRALPVKLDVLNDELLKKGEDPKKALEKCTGTYGRFSKEMGAVKFIDPRHE